MALAGRTREQLRVHVGENLNAVYPSSASSNGSTTTIVDTSLVGSDNDHIGKWVLFTSGGNDGKLRQVSDFVASTSTLTIPVAVTSTVSGDTYELWNQDFSPTLVHGHINQAILKAYGRVYDPVEDTSLFADGHTARFDIPSGLSMISRLSYRGYVTNLVVHDCDATFDETTDSDFTQAADDEDKKDGSASLKLTIGSGVSAGDFVTDSITSVDLSKYTHIEGWVKATSTLAAGDFVLRLDNGTVLGNSTDLEILSIPATVAADTWTPFSVALANPESDSAIVSIGLEYNANQGANTVWFDHIRATVQDEAIWTKLPDRLWRIDKEARDLVLTGAGVGEAGYAMLKINGGGAPTLLTADSTATEIDDAYVVEQATATLLGTVALSGGADSEIFRNVAGYYERRAAMSARRFPMLVDVRRVE